MSTTSTRAPRGCDYMLLAGGLVGLFGLFVLAVPLTIIGYGIDRAITQDRLLRAARPVEATVVSSQVGESPGRRGRRRNLPVIVFRYEVAGRTYQSDHTMLLAARGKPDGMAARQFVDAYPPGATVQAYYVPDEPRRAFLLKEYNEFPYVAIYIGLGIFALILASGVGYAFVPVAAPGARRGSDWRPLAIRRPLRARVWVNLAQGVVYLGVWGWTAWHYFTHVPPPHGVAGHAVTWGMGLPGLWYLFSSARAHFTRRAVSDARVALREPELRVGGEAHVRVEQNLLGDIVLERVRIGLVCEKTSGTGKNATTAVHWQTWAQQGAPPKPSRCLGTAGRRVSFTESLSIPTDLPASQSHGDPRYKWKLVVETALAGCPDYREEFEIVVQSPERLKVDS